MHPAIGLIVGVFNSWLDRRGRVKEAKTQAEIANVGKVIDGAGWKDEFIVGVWSIPAIMAFVPGGADYAQQGFENLRAAPEWYIVGWVSISLAVYGIKPAARKIVEWKNGKEK